MLAPYVVAGLALTPVNAEVANHASNGNGYVITAAAMATVISLIGIPIWKLLRSAKREREHNADLLGHVVAGVYGKGEQRENGVLVEAAVPGMLSRLDNLEQQFRSGSPAIEELSKKLDRHNSSIGERLSRNEREIAEARKAAGDAAIVAARVDDRLKLVNDRVWEWISELQARNEGLSAVLHELGYDIDSLPTPGNGEHASADADSTR